MFVQLLSFGCYLHDLSKIARSFFEELLYSFFSMRFVSVYVVDLYSSIDTGW